MNTQDLAISIIQTMPVKIKFWLIVSKLPFTSDWFKTYIFNNKVLPWIVSQSVEKLLKKVPNCSETRQDCISKEIK